MPKPISFDSMPQNIPNFMGSTLSKPIFYTVQATIGSNGTAVVNLTKDGTATGAALFKTIAGVVTTVLVTGTMATDIAYASYNLSADLKQLTVRASKGTTVSILGAISVSFVASGTKISVVVIGE